MPAIKIEPNHKITIPKELRDTFGFHVGEKVEITVRRPKAPKTYTPTARELRTIEKGREEIRKGNYYTLDEFRTYLVGSPHKKAGPKKSQARTKTRA